MYRKPKGISALPGRAMANGNLAWQSASERHGANVVHEGRRGKAPSRVEVPPILEQGCRHAFGQHLLRPFDSTAPVLFGGEAGEFSTAADRSQLAGWAKPLKADLLSNQSRAKTQAINAISRDHWFVSQAGPIGTQSDSGAPKLLISRLDRVMSCVQRKIKKGVPASLLVSEPDVSIFSQRAGGS